MEIIASANEMYRLLNNVTKRPGNEHYICELVQLDNSQHFSSDYYTVICGARRFLFTVINMISLLTNIRFVKSKYFVIISYFFYVFTYI